LKISKYKTIILRVQNPVKANLVYNLIRNYFRTTKFRLAHDNDVKTLSGTDEGIDEWLTVNFLQDNLKSARQTLRLIRLGDSSTQIAFLSKSTIKSSVFFFKN
jgi:Golgi nucleoside diphosphatase